VFEWNQNVHDAVYRDLTLGNLPFCWAVTTVWAWLDQRCGALLPEAGLELRVLGSMLSGLQHDELSPSGKPARDAPRVPVRI